MNCEPPLVLITVGMSGVQVNASFGSNTKEGCESPHHILVLFFDCEECERGPKKNQILHLPEPLVFNSKNRGVRNKDKATLDVSMAKQKRKREALALSTIVKLSSAKLLRRIPHPPRVKRRTHHRPGRRCCVTQSEGQVSKYSVLGTGLPPEKVRSTRFSLVACHFISGLSAPKFGAVMEYESRFPETRDSCQYNIL